MTGTALGAGETGGTRQTWARPSGESMHSFVHATNTAQPPPYNQALSLVSVHRREQTEQKSCPRDFPGGPVVKARCSQHWGPGFDPWPGN